MNITDEAKVLWDKLSKEEQASWTTKERCQNCKRDIDPQEFSVSLSEDQLALFHMCPQCATKEVRLIASDSEKQQKIDDDFERWVQAKKKANPDKYGK